MTNLYKGYSFEQFSQNKSIRLYDTALIHKDLKNNIFTRRGERVKMFRYGTRIPDLVFEPMDDVIFDAIEQDLMDVFNNEPRVKLVDLKLVPIYDNSVVVVNAVLYYVELNFTGQFSVNIQFET
jgi:phage baseplate assembly protein W